MIRIPLLPYLCAHRRAQEVMVRFTALTFGAIAFGVATPPAVLAQPFAQRPARPTIEDLVRRALVADSARDNRGFLRATRDLVRLLPSHPAALYLAARAQARAGDTAGALSLLRRTVSMGDTRPFEREIDFASLRGSATYPAIELQAARNRQPVSASTIALTIPDTNFLPEAIAVDSDGAIYAGSLARREVVRLTRDSAAGQTHTERIAGGSDGLLRVVGMKFDGGHMRLWFATWAPAGDTVGGAARRVTQARLFAYSLSGRTLRQYDIADSAHGHLLNDLIEAPDGDLYLTDTEDSSIWRLRAGQDSLERFLRLDPRRFHGPNGIAIAPGGQRLYVAFTAGIAAIDIRKRSARYLALAPDVTTAGVDGLYWYRNSLIAVQGLGTDERVVRFDLDAEGHRVCKARVLERGGVFQRPTTGVVVGNEFFFIPNAQYHRLANDGSVRTDAAAAPSVVLRLRLDRH